MKSLGLATGLLGATVALRGVSPVGAAATLVLAVAASAAAAIGAARNAEAAGQRAALAQAAPTTLQPAAGALTRTADNVASFYRALGEVRYGEQQVRTLFGLADKTGLVLSEGEYLSSYDKGGRFHTYRITLPVRGPYGAVWQFAMLSLSSIPFASLDEISFRRNSVGETDVQARVRLTIYLADAEPR